jgi:hypothetical protein|tara:strand:+ start:618 stop:863 length:246 start_codon:yes stop_codon:yes gene_type:complete
MINAKELAKQLNNFLKSPTCQNARVQVKLPKGEFHSPDGHFDIHSITLFENNIIGSRESHRLVFEITAETWRMGSVKKKKL